MRRFIVLALILLMVSIAFTDCYSRRKNDMRLRSLMIQDNKKLGRNRAYYSKHNKKTKRDAYRKYRRNRRYR